MTCKGHRVLGCKPSTIMTADTLDKLNDVSVVGNTPYFFIADRIKSLRHHQTLVNDWPHAGADVIARWQAQAAEDERRAMHLLKKYGAILPTIVEPLARREFMSSKGSKETWAKWEVRNGDTRQIFSTRKDADSFARFIRKHGLDYAIRRWSTEG